MTSNGETDVQLIAEQTSWHRLLNAIIGFVCFLFGISFCMVAISVTPPPPENNFYAIWLFIMLFVVLLALLRNKIVYIVFWATSRSRFLSLVYFGRIVTYGIIIYCISFFIVGSLYTNAEMISFSIGLFFMFASIFLIFSDPLTDIGELKILFELLFTYLNDFEDRQQWLKTISKKVESQFKRGNIKVPHNVFVYYFNMALMKGTDVQNDLRSIETWMIDKKTPCFDSIKKIYPEEKFEPYTKVSFSRQLLENPTPIIKYGFLLILAIILIVLHPELVSEALKIFGL